MLVRLIGTILVLVGVIAVATRESTAKDVRYRVTIEVETPAGLRTGSRIWTLQLRPSFTGMGGPSRRAHGQGEAIAVDLPNGRTLFGLLSSRSENGGATNGLILTMLQNVYADHGLTRAYRPHYHGRTDSSDAPWLIEYIAGLPRRRLTVECARPRKHVCPYLATFGDPGQQQSAQEVLPDNLAAAFGPGYRLRAVTLELVDDRPDSDMTDRLPWLAGMDSDAPLERHIRGGPLTTAMYLHDWDFIER